MSEQKIEVGSLWREEFDGGILRVEAVLHVENEEHIVYSILDDNSKVNWSGLHVQRTSKFLEGITPHIREPKVGEVWKWKNDDTRQFEIIAPPRDNLSGCDMAVWCPLTGYDYVDYENINRLEYVRQGPI